MNTQYSYLMNCFHTDICWLRLDFETFTNQGLALTTEVASTACVDTFTVTTSTSGTNNYPVICGDNTGQHSKVFTVNFERNYKSTYYELKRIMLKL